MSGPTVEENQLGNEAALAQQEERRVRIEKLKAECKAEAILKLKEDKEVDFVPPDDTVNILADMMYKGKVLQFQLEGAHQKVEGLEGEVEAAKEQANRNALPNVNWTGDSISDEIENQGTGKDEVKADDGGKMINVKETDVIALLHEMRKDIDANKKNSRKRKRGSWDGSDDESDDDLDYAS